MPVSSRILVTVRNAEFRRALVEQLRITPNLVATGRTPDPANPSSQLADLVLTDLDNVPSKGANSTPFLALGSPPPPKGMDPQNFVATPVRFVDLLTRIRAAIRELNANNLFFRIGPVEFHAGKSILLGADGRTHSLTDKERDALSYICRAGNRSVPRSELLGIVWGYAATVETHTVETHISRLRTILREAGTPNVLTAEKGCYRLVPEATITKPDHAASIT